MGILVEARGLRYRYEDGNEALCGVDLVLHQGETLILLGPNGSGKTTFVLHLNGLLRGEGHLSVCGLTVEPANFAALRRKVGMVFQDADEQLFLPTILEDVAYGLLNQGADPRQARDKAREALAQVGLSGLEDRPPYHLSGGEKRRAALAGVLVMEPELLVLDEPTTSLDPPGQRELAHLLQALPQAKLITTHDIGFAKAVADRAVFFDQGRVAAEGPLDQIIDRFHWRGAVPRPAAARDDLPLADAHASNAEPRP